VKSGVSKPTDLARRAIHVEADVDECVLASRHQHRRSGWTALTGARSAPRMTPLMLVSCDSIKEIVCGSVTRGLPNSSA